MAEIDPVSNLLTGRQAYRLDVRGTPAATALSVVSFTATEKMSEASVVLIVATHPQQLARADFLNQDGTFSITQEDGTTGR
ncbi:hypothetical protein [Paraburkholderia sp. J41]|uniref:hypothetical protein n=1 Tax=Paraburkholderia sp. J41 TaxID=2805433 RepID=UPI002AC32EDF|nr:hypothetical protein [Paraburkholderia sp. J41]